MLGDGLSRLALLALGYLYPAYKTFKVVQLPATRSNDMLLRHWCQYWALMAVFTAAQPLADTFCWWLPLYYEAKLGLAVYLWANELSGARHVWDRWFQPAVARYEPVVDRRLAESKAVARDWLHSNTMRLLALAQQKALAWLAQVQAQAQQAAGRVAGAGGPAEAATDAAAPRRQRSSRRRGGSRSRAPPVEELPSDEDEELSAGEEENAVAANRSTRGRKAAGKAAAAAAGAAPEEPIARFSSFSLASFYSARSSDLQAADVKAGLKGFPVLFAGADARSPGSSKDD